MDFENLYVAEFTSDTVVEDGIFLKDALLFETGKHRGKEFTLEDLQILAQSFDSGNPVPVQLDHSSSTKDTVGFVKKVWIEGEKLLGQLQIVDEKMQQRIEKGLSKKLSIGFYVDGKTRKPSSLREVSIVAFPQVKSATIFKEEENGGEPDMDEKRIEELREQLAESLRAEYEEKLEKYAEMERQLEELREKEVQAQAEQFVAQYSEKVLPAQAEVLTKLVVGLSEEQLELLTQFLEIEEKVELGELGEEHGNLSDQEKADLEYAEWKKMLDGK